eukprot:CAMPEP_0175096026 /NCGR_PEP_ID=MMETSP0086_2-20121207/4499_1 /TAXON_ID=136419 /ORGANISM="Unknown Unknown, Strain D1" /LENGTH=430 /DNA_ID=CAMNT_0016369373 /DNA_START=18 /DNA_END=1310 /DNA_ORIENTATION=-
MKQGSCSFRSFGCRYNASDSGHCGKDQHEAACAEDHLKLVMKKYHTQKKEISTFRSSMTSAQTRCRNLEAKVTELEQENLHLKSCIARLGEIQLSEIYHQISAFLHAPTAHQGEESTSSLDSSLEAVPLSMLASSDLPTTPRSIISTKPTSSVSASLPAPRSPPPPLSTPSYKSTSTATSPLHMHNQSLERRVQELENRVKEKDVLLHAIQAKLSQQGGVNPSHSTTTTTTTTANALLSALPIFSRSAPSSNAPSPSNNRATSTNASSVYNFSSSIALDPQSASPPSQQKIVSLLSFKNMYNTMVSCAPEPLAQTSSGNSSTSPADLNTRHSDFCADSNNTTNSTCPPSDTKAPHSDTSSCAVEPDHITRARAVSLDSCSSGNDSTNTEFHKTPSGTLPVQPVDGTSAVTGGITGSLVAHVYPTKVPQVY